MLDLDKVDAAERAMTAAPWAANGLDSGDERWRRANSVWTNHHPIARDEDGEEMCVASSSHDWGTVESPDERDANMRGIALLRNAAPEMIARIREQDAEIARLQSAVHDLEDMVSAAESRANDRSSTIAELRALCGATAEREAKLREVMREIIGRYGRITGLPASHILGDLRAALESKGGE